MQYKYAEIADTVYFWFALNDVTGTASDGASPLYDVRLAGGAAGDAPTASGTPTLLTHASYSPGLFEIAIDTTGYSAGEYSVFCTATVSSVNPAGFCGSFKLRTAGTPALAVDTIAISSDVTAANNLETACDNYSATRGLSGTALPAAAADAAGGLPISDAGSLDLDTKLAETNEITAARMGALTDWIDNGRLDLLLDAVPTVTEFNARTLVSADYTIVSDLGVVQTGDTFALANGASGFVAIKEETSLINAYTTETLDDLADGGRLDLIFDGIKAETDKISSATAIADGDTPTTNSLAHALRFVKWFSANEWQVDESASPDTLTVFKADNTTTGFQFQVYTSSQVTYRDPV